MPRACENVEVELRRRHLPSTRWNNKPNRTGQGIPKLLLQQPQLLAAHSGRALPKRSLPPRAPLRVRGGAFFLLARTLPLRDRILGLRGPIKSVQPSKQLVALLLHVLPAQA